MANNVQIADVPTLAQVRSRRAEIIALADRYKAINIRVFGSVARGDATPDSDIDLLVDFQAGATIWDAVGLWQDLQDLLARDVSLIGEDNRDTRLMQNILKEAILL